MCRHRLQRGRRLRAAGRMLPGPALDRPVSRQCVADPSRAQAPAERRRRRRRRRGIGSARATGRAQRGAWPRDRVLTPSSAPPATDPRQVEPARLESPLDCRGPRPAAGPDPPARVSSVSARTAPHVVPSSAGSGFARHAAAAAPDRPPPPGRFGNLAGPGRTSVSKASCRRRGACGSVPRHAAPDRERPAAGIGAARGASATQNRLFFGLAVRRAGHAAGRCGDWACAAVASCSGRARLSRRGAALSPEPTVPSGVAAMLRC